MRLSFTVWGRPQPQGSMKAFMPKGAKFPVLTSDNAKLKPWRQEIASLALVAMREAGQNLHSRPGGVEVRATFFFSKPASAKKAVTEKTTKPDVEKLLRGLFDAMTGIVYEDDAQVVAVVSRKQFGLPERTEVEVIAL